MDRQDRYEEPSMKTPACLTRHHKLPPAATYQLTDRLHAGRVVQVPADAIPVTVSAWLSEPGVHSPLVREFADAVGAGDWPAALALGDWLSIDIAVA